MKVWRVMVATEDVVSPEAAAPFPGIQHVVYVVAPSKAAIPDVLAKDKTCRHLGRRHIPRIMDYSDTRDDIPTDLPLWTVKIGPKTSDEAILSIVAAKGGAYEIEAALLRLHREQPQILEMLKAGWYRVNPNPIDLTKPGVW